MKKKKKTSKKEKKSHKLLWFLIAGLCGLSLVMSVAAMMDLKIITYRFDFDFEDVEYINASTVFIEDDIYDRLNSRYSSDRDEFIYCVYGNLKDDYYTITEIKETKYSSDEGSLTYKTCEETEGFLGTIHSHPEPLEVGYIASCSMSKQDVFTFGATDTQLNGIICGVDKIAFYTPNNLEKSILVEKKGD